MELVGCRGGVHPALNGFGTSIHSQRSSRETLLIHSIDHPPQQRHNKPHGGQRPPCAAVDGVPHGAIFHQHLIGKKKSPDTLRFPNANMIGAFMFSRKDAVKHHFSSRPQALLAKKCFNRRELLQENKKDPTHAWCRRSASRQHLQSSRPPIPLPLQAKGSTSETFNSREPTSEGGEGKSYIQLQSTHEAIAADTSTPRFL